MDRALRIIDADCAIIFAQVLDPVGAGLVTSLARPGANVTGVSIMLEELSGKYLELQGGRSSTLAGGGPLGARPASRRTLAEAH
jgi:hypothetical protein